MTLDAIPKHHAPLGVFGRYALYQEIAKGGMASVHLGRFVGPAGFARTVAIKRLHPQHTCDPEFIAMFRDEARLSSHIHHPNVIPTIDVITTGDQLFLVMEYVHGESLSSLLRLAQKLKEPVAPTLISNVLCGLLYGLHAAHEATDETGNPLNIVHRDVSPQNVLVGADGIVRIFDFGIAKAEGQSHHTQHGQVKGKFRYMAPEQLIGGPVTRQADVYGASVILWEALVGRRLIEGEGLAQIGFHILRNEIKPPSSLRSDLPVALDEIVMCGLTRDPAQRYPTARAMAEALEEALGPVSTQGISRWVDKLAGPRLAKRELLLKEIEASSRALSLRDEVLQTPSSLSALVASTRIVPSPSGSHSRVDTPSHSLSVSEPNATFNSRVTNNSVKKPPRPQSRWQALVWGGSLGVMLLAAAAGGWHLSQHSASVHAEVFRAGAQPLAGDASSTLPQHSNDMVPIAQGSFCMGSDSEEAFSFERPSHEVRLHSFFLDKTEVTVEAYRACSERGECPRAPSTAAWTMITLQDKKAYSPLCNIDGPGKDKHPINCVDWNMANTYCHAQGKRLPTSAEWEYALQGSEKRMFPWGDAPPSAHLLNACGMECDAWGKQHSIALKHLYNQEDGFPTTAPVGSFPQGRSPSGLDDMSGNVMEWVSDWNEPYAATPQLNPQGPAAGTEHVVRGGAWNTGNRAWLRPSFRSAYAPETRNPSIGFRCANNAP